MIRRQTQIRIRYRDTDQMGVVYHGVYLEFFETGRTELLRQIGMPYSSLEATGVMLPVLDAWMKINRPARYDDLITVTTFLRDPITARMKLEYEIDRDGLLLVTGHTIHAFTTVDGMKPVRPPRQFLQVLEAAEEPEQLITGKELLDIP